MSSDLYQQLILDHNRRPKNFEALEDSTHSCQGYNPLCGDEYTIYLRIVDDTVERISFQGSGCAISKASASMMTQRLAGRSADQATKIFDQFHGMLLGRYDPDEEPDHDLGKLKIFKGVRDYPSRVKCASLAWHALRGAMREKAVVSTEVEP